MSKPDHLRSLTRPQLKVRGGPSGIHMFDRTTGLNLLLDEARVPPASWATAPRQVSIALTNACDLACSHCYAPKNPATLEFERLASWLRELDTNADAYDNSMAESFVSSIKRELIHRHSWPNRQMARTAIFEYIEGFYNTRRRHSALGHLSPLEYEEVRLRGGAVA